MVRFLWPICNIRSELFSSNGNKGLHGSHIACLGHNNDIYGEQTLSLFLTTKMTAMETTKFKWQLSLILNTIISKYLACSYALHFELWLVKWTWDQYLGLFKCTFHIFSINAGSARPRAINTPCFWLRKYGINIYAAVRESGGWGWGADLCRKNWSTTVFLQTNPWEWDFQSHDTYLASF